MADQLVASQGGMDRALVLGGGGLTGVAWGAAYLEGLIGAGVDLRAADVIVGTSAGGLAGLLLMHGGLGTTRRLLLALASNPLTSRLAPSGPAEVPSAMRALDLFTTHHSADPVSVAEVGHAALAANTQPEASYLAIIAAVLRMRRWPASNIRLTTHDAYTGERVVFSAADDVPVLRAAAATTAVPGFAPPIRVGDRRCMDGGFGSPTNADLVLGADRVLMIGLMAPVPELAVPGLQPPMEREAAMLIDAGSEVRMHLPDRVLAENLMDPSAVGDAARAGSAQARRDAPELREFWGAPLPHRVHGSLPQGSQEGRSS